MFHLKIRYFSLLRIAKKTQTLNEQSSQLTPNRKHPIKLSIIAM